MDMLTDSQLLSLEITERTASCFSLLGASFIIFTFVASPAFRKPVNRLIFYASWGNMMGNAATLIAQSGVRAGRNSHLCQFQGFLIQMFFIADALWNLAMAINVYLTIFKKYNAKQLKALEWRYLLLCYGLPFVVALSYVFVNSPTRMYGPAQLWCWIRSDWAVFRIVLFYGPAWICMIIALTLYVMSGREIFRKRQELRAFRTPSPNFVEDPFTGYKTTEVSVTSEPMSEEMPVRPANIFDASYTRRGLHEHSPSQKVYEPYTTTIHSPPASTIIDHIPHSTSNSTVSVKRYRAAVEANTAAWRYTKVAMLFFISLCITWVPSSANRIYDLAHPHKVSYSLNFIAAIVLPLMGFWNGVIYFVTTRAVCAEFFWNLVPMRVSRGRDRGSRARMSLVEPSMGRRSRLDEWSPSDSTRHITGDAKDEEAL